MNKPKILILVDNHFWCWEKTMQDLAYSLPEYDITIMSAFNFKKLDSNYNRWDFIYCRGGAHEFWDNRNSSRVIPFISTFSTGGKQTEERIKAMADKTKLGWGLVVQNKAAFHRCRLERYNNIFIIPNGVNTNVYFPADKRPTIHYVGIAGNTRESDGRNKLKGLHYLIPAIKKVKGLQMAEANADKQFENKEVDIRKQLSYEEMALWYRALTIYAQPSDSEGCSNSVMEAMSTGLPCLIVEGVGYHGEVCLDAIKHEAGQVIFVKRNTQDIQEKLELLMKDKKLYARVSKNARQFALNHDWKYISQKYKAMFDEFIPIAKELKKRKNIISERTYNISNNADIAKVVDDFAMDRKMQKGTKTAIDILEILGYIK